MFSSKNVFLAWMITILIVFMIDIVIVFKMGWHKNKKLLKKEKEVKLWNKKNKLTATNDLVDFILMKLYEEPNEWVHTKCSDIYWWKYKDANIYVGSKKPGDVYHCSVEIKISNSQRKEIITATNNMEAVQALRNMMKVAIKNVT